MAKLESSLKNMLIVLTVIALVAGGALASVYMLTAEPIQQSKEKKSQDAILAVLPAFEKTETVSSPDGLTIHKAYASDGSFVGAAVESFSNNGFSGEVKVMVGFDNEGNIVNYSVLEQKETPGLGTKMIDWFKPQGEVEKSLVEKLFGFEVKTAERNSSVIGKNPATDKLTVKQDGGDIDAITASTISSRAFLETIAAAYKSYVAANDKSIETAADATAETITDGNTGATASAEKGGNNE